jgi:hypothetical protein
MRAVVDAKEKERPWADTLVELRTLLLQSLYLLCHLHTALPREDVRVRAWARVRVRVRVRVRTLPPRLLSAAPTRRAHAAAPAAQRRKKLRIATVGVSGGGSIAHAAVARRPPIPLHTMVPRTTLVWDLSIVQGLFSVAPRQP